MKLIKRISVVGFFMFLTLTLSLTVMAENWWESKQENSATDNIQVSSSQVSGQTESASRTNWIDGYIEVMAGATADMRDTVNLAHAYSVALKTARHLAYEKLAETINGLNLYGDATYDRELLRDSNLKTVLRAMIRGARVVNEKKSQFSDGSIWAEVTLGMKLFGEDGLIKPSVEWNDRQQVKISPAPEPKSIETATAAPPAPAKAYTGLIVDAGGLGAVPAMLPKILAENGDVLYGTGEIDKNYILQFGLVGYQSSLSEAAKLDRVGANPLVVKAKTISGKNNADFVVTNKDAERIKTAVAGKDFLKECRVVAILN